MTDEQYLRSLLGCASSTFSSRDHMAVLWAISEIDQLRSTEHSDAAKWRAAVKLAGEMQVFDMDTAKAAILSLVQRLEAAEEKIATAKRNARELREMLDGMLERKA